MALPNRSLEEWQQRLESRAYHLAGLALLALAVCVIVDPFREPLLGDRAYLTYLGQAITRGIPIYSNTFFGYPPLPALLSAASMQLGGWFGVPSYLTPRFAGIAVYVACALLAYLVTRHATRSAWAGGFAAITMISFSHFTTLSVSNLEPKSLTVLAAWSAAAAVQQRKPLFAGLATGLCAMCWQPAGVVVLGCSAVIAWDAGWRRLLPSVLRFGLGVALGLLPVVLYLSLSGSWEAFWLRTIVAPAELQLKPFAHPRWWLYVIWGFWTNEWPFFVVAALGFAAFIFASPFRGLRGMVQVWFDRRMGAMPVFMSGWIVFNSLDFQGPPDVVPMIAATAFWAGWSFHLLLRALQRFPKLALATAASVMLAATAYGVGDALLHEPGITLDEERAIVDEIIGGLEPGETIVTFEAPAFYVLAERTSPMPFLAMNVVYARMARLVDRHGCVGVGRRTLAMRPSVVVIQEHRFQSRCIRELGRRLEGTGYEKLELELGWNRHTSYVPADPPVAVIQWHVYFATPRPKQAPAAKQGAGERTLEEHADIES